MRKLRVICSDPNATDCSSEEDDEGREKKSIGLKRVVHQIHLDDEIPCEGRRHKNPKEQRRAWNRTSKSPYKGVFHRRSGKWSSEIRDPISKARIWLGTFGSAEEAYRVYLAKKLEFQARAMVLSKPKDEPMVSPSSVLENECSISPSDDSNSERSAAAAEEDSGRVEGLTMEQFSQISGGRELDSDSILELGSLIIDNNGFLLGEFSRLDDLWICDVKEDDN